MQIPFSIILFYFFAAVAIIQFGYWLFFSLGIFRLKKNSGDPGKLAGISVVVAAHNEIENLKRLVPELLKQNYPQFEIILVNDRSDDGTDEYLIELESTQPLVIAKHIYDLPDHISGKKYALTLGIKAARFKQLLLTDADCVPASEHWIHKMAAGFKGTTDIVLGFSTYKKLPGFLNYFIRYETILTAIAYLGAASNRLPYMGVGRNLAYKKDLFLEKKGFFGYQDLIGGDDDLFINKHATARNTAVVVGSEALTISEPKTTFYEFWQQKTRHLQIGKRYSFNSKLGLGLFNLSWILFWITGLWCIAINQEPVLVAAALAARFVLILITFGLATKRLGIGFGLAGIIFVDMLYCIYFIFVGIRALFVKTISWS